MVAKREQYQPLAIGDISTVSDEEWANHWRHHGSGWQNPDLNNPCYLKRAYGGSDMAAIMGVSPWKTRLQLYHEKSGVEPLFKRSMNEDAKELGHIYETAIALKYHYYQRKKGIKNLTMYVEGYVVNPDGKWKTDSEGNRVKNPISMMMYRDGRRNPDGSFKYPFALANCDGFLREGNADGILEIKTTSSRNIETINHWKDGIVPQYYLLQCVWYMFILNVQFVDICCSWGQGMDEMAVIRINRDYDIEKTLVDSVIEFDEYVEQGIEPDVSCENGELLIQHYYEMFGPVNKSEPFIELPEKFRGTVMRAVAIEKDVEMKEKELKEAKAKKASIYAELYPVFKTSSYGQFRIDDKQVAGITLKTPMKRGKFDLERFKNEHKDLYDMYQTFDCVGFAESSNENKRLKKKYMLPSEPDLEDPSKMPTFSLSILDRPIVK